jgi:hypothetical protein
MNRIYLLCPIVFVLACCSTVPKITVPTLSPTPVADIPPALMPAPVGTVDPTIFGKAGSDLKALGYLVGKAHDPNDPTFQHAVIAFEKDQGLAEDGLLTAALMEKIHAVRVSMRIVSTPKAGVYIYVGHPGREAITLATAPEGFSSDASLNFLSPLHSGRQSTLVLIRKGAVSEKVTCKVGKAVSDESLLMSDTLSVECKGDRGTSWRDLFSPQLGAVIKRQVGEHTEVLVAVRPATAHWPNAARTGLDWAITSALEAPQGAAPVKWSSTAIAASFEIRASKSSSISGPRTVQTNVPVSCRRFELIESGTSGTLPGIACQGKDGAWSIAGTKEGISPPSIIQNASR